MKVPFAPSAMIHLPLIGLPTGGDRLVPANFGHKATVYWGTGSTRRLSLGRNQSREMALSSPTIGEISKFTHDSFYLNPVKYRMPININGREKGKVFFMVEHL